MVDSSSTELPMSLQKRSSGTRVLISLLLVSLAAAAQGASAQGGSQPFTVEDLLSLKRLSDPQVSPDGRYVAYVLRETDMDANKGRTDIWLLDLAQKDPQPRRLTSDPANDMSPRWTSDSHGLYFLDTRWQLAGMEHPDRWGRGDTGHQLPARCWRAEGCAARRRARYQHGCAAGM